MSSNIFKQAKLVRKPGGDFKLRVGKNKYIDIAESLKTLNGESLIGEGNIDIEGGGSSPSVEARLSNLESLLHLLNRLPTVEAVLKAIADTALSITGNLLDSVTDQDGDAVEVVSYSYGGVTRQLGQTVITAYGAMLVNADGTYLYVPSDAARALAPGQVANEVFAFTVVDSRGGRGSGPFQISITGTNHGPVARFDSASVPAGTTATGNVLANDTDYEGSPLTLVSFQVAGNPTVYTPGQTAVIAGYGSLSIAANGAFSMVPVDDEVHGTLPDVNCTVSDGVNESVSLLRIIIAPPPPTASEVMAFLQAYRSGAIAPDPARLAIKPLPPRPLPDRSQVVATYPGWTYALRLPNQTGRPANARDFEVGPGKTWAYHELPTEYFLPGDRVFLSWDGVNPIQTLISFSSRGREDAWIELIGVRHANGSLPVIDGAGAACIPTDRYFDANEGTAAISFMPLPTGMDGQAQGAKPGYIHVHGLEITNFHPSKSFTRRNGSTSAYGDFAAAFYGRGVDFLCLSGNKLHHNGNGLFINSTNEERFQTRGLHVLGNWVYDNSALASSHTHNAYTEGIATIYEYNYFERVLTGSYGDTIKERSTGLVMRYNFIKTSANAISLRDPSSEGNGYYERTMRDSFGELMVQSAFVYGNTFVVEQDTPNAVIGTGDGFGDQAREGNLYFYSNVVVARLNGVGGYLGGIYYDPFRIPIFGALNTRSPITFHVRNNLFFTTTASPAGPLAEFGLFYWQGIADWQSNWINQFANTAVDSNYSSLAAGSQFNGAGLGGLVESSSSPGFVDVLGGDFELVSGSPFNSLAAPVHPFAVARNLLPLRRSVLYPFDELPKPINKSAPTVSGNLAAGSTLTKTPGVYSPLTSLVIHSKWLRNGVEVPGATGDTIDTDPVNDMGAVYSVEEWATNASGSSSHVYSNSVTMVSATTPQCISAPVISGPGQVTFEHVVSTGTWTNDPDHFTYRAIENGAVVDTDNAYTPGAGAAARTLQWEVTAHKGDEVGVAMSNIITLAAVTMDPELATGVWHIDGPSGSKLTDLSSKWNGRDYGTYGVATDHYTCDGAGALQVSYYYANNNPSWFWLQDGQGDMVGVEATFEGSNGGFSLLLRANQTQGYRFEYTGSRVYVMRNDAWPPLEQIYGADIAPGSTVTVKVIPTALGTFNIYLDGVLLGSATDPAPLTGGYPGAQFGLGKMLSWTDNPAD